MRDTHLKCAGTGIRRLRITSDINMAKLNIIRRWSILNILPYLQFSAPMEKDQACCPRQSYLLASILQFIVLPESRC